MEIGAMGLSFLVTETRQAETARAKEIDAAAENATLADAGIGIEDGLNMALVYHAAYYGVAPENAPTVSVAKNLDGTRLSAQMVAILSKLRAEFQLSASEFRELLARGGIITPAMAEPEAIAEAELLAALDRPDANPLPLSDTEPA
jgi:hypothetical protein